MICLHGSLLFALVALAIVGASVTLFAIYSYFRPSP